MSQLGAFIRQRRLALGLTQEELGERSGLKWGRQAVSKIETGRYGANAEARRAFARVLGVRHVDLLVASGELLPEEVPDGSGLPPASEVDRLFQALTPISKQSALGYLRQLVELDRLRAREARGAAPQPATNPTPAGRNTNEGLQ